MSHILAALIAASTYGGNYATPPPVVATKTPSVEWVQSGVMKLTFFTCSAEELTSRCVGKWTGTRPIEGRTVASPDLPPGTVIELEGFGRRLVEDKCGGCESGELDVFTEDRGRAIDLGVQYVKARLVEPLVCRGGEG